MKSLGLRVQVVQVQPERYLNRKDEMFETLKAEEASQDKQCDEFIDLYARFKQDVEKMSDKATQHDRFRMRQFEVKIDAAWQKMPEEKREILVEALFFKKLLPEEIRAALRVFNGKVVRVA